MVDMAALEFSRRHETAQERQTGRGRAPVVEPPGVIARARTKVTDATAPSRVPAPFHDSGVPEFPHCVGGPLPDHHVPIRAGGRVRSWRYWDRAERLIQRVGGRARVNRSVEVYAHPLLVRRDSIDRGAVGGGGDRRSKTTYLGFKS